jgi:hypothetical protein
VVESETTNRLEDLTHRIESGERFMTILFQQGKIKVLPREERWRLGF